MDEPVLLGISGAKRSGKDTVCALLVDLGIPAQRTAFADEIKFEVARACGVMPSHIEANKEFYRPALQWWGDFRRRNCGDHYWIDRVGTQITDMTREGAKVIVITDVRLPIEAEFIQRYGGFLWRVTRHESIVARLMGAFRKPEHNTEAHFNVLPYHDEIKNSGTLGDLRGRVLDAALRSPLRRFIDEPTQI